MKQTAPLRSKVHLLAIKSNPASTLTMFRLVHGMHGSGGTAPMANTSLWQAPAVPMAYATVTAAPSNKKRPTASSPYVNVTRIHSESFRYTYLSLREIVSVCRRPSQLTCETELYGVLGRSIHEHKRAWIEMERMGNLTLQGKAKWPMCCIFSRPNLIRQNGRIILTSASTEFLGLSRTP